MDYQIALLGGDGIGPEVIAQAARVLERVGTAFGHSFVFKPALIGGCAIDATGSALPDETLAACRSADAVLLGAVGGPRWDTLPGHLRPERALLGLRAALGLYANIRPARLFPELIDACPLREQVAKQGFDMVFVRELTGGMYFGERGRREGKYGPEAYDTECYSEFEVRRIARTAFERSVTTARPTCASLICTNTSPGHAMDSPRSRGRIDCPCIVSGTGSPAASRSVGGRSTRLTSSDS